MINFDKLKGMAVITKDGRQFGTVTEADIDENTWKVASLGVRLERDVCEDFGIERKLFGGYTVHILTKHIAAVSDIVVLEATLAELGEERDKMLPDQDATPPARPTAMG